MILVIEGDQNVGGLFVSAFAQNGWESEYYADAGSATAALETNNQYDAILMSYRISGSDGVELTRLIRSMAPHANTPILMVTGSGGVEPEALAAGVNRVLKKPLDLEKLFEAIERCIEEAGRPSLVRTAC
jgi:CheY-like chemotaxis protein